MIEKMTKEEYSQQVLDAGTLFTNEAAEAIWKEIAKVGEKITNEGKIHHAAMEHALWIMFLGIMMYPFQESLDARKAAFGRYALQLRSVLEAEAIDLGIVVPRQ